MTVKAVYASKTLAIYITGKHVDRLLQGNIVLGPIIAANETLVDEGVDVRMTVPGIQKLRQLREMEEAVYRSGKMAKMAEQHTRRMRGLDN